MRTFSLEWLARWILSFGSEAEARSPEKLRGLVRGEAEAVLQRYR
jgi:predicted DNA-binding transcriptional regulator YafY